VKQLTATKTANFTEYTQLSICCCCYSVDSYWAFFTDNVKPLSFPSLNLYVWWWLLEEGVATTVILCHGNIKREPFFSLKKRFSLFFLIKN